MKGSFVLILKEGGGGNSFFDLYWIFFSGKSSLSKLKLNSEDLFTRSHLIGSERCFFEHAHNTFLSTCY